MLAKEASSVWSFSFVDIWNHIFPCSGDCSSIAIPLFYSSVWEKKISNFRFLVNFMNLANEWQKLKNWRFNSGIITELPSTIAFHWFCLLKKWRLLLWWSADFWSKRILILATQPLTGGSLFHQQNYSTPNFRFWLVSFNKLKSCINKLISKQPYHHAIKSPKVLFIKFSFSQR